MDFDYSIVLVFALAGGVFALVKRRNSVGNRSGHAGAEPAEDAGARVLPAMVATVFAAATLVLIPWALVVRDCLRDTDAAQGRGIGAGGLLAGVGFLAVLSLGMLYASRSRIQGPDRGRSGIDPTADGGS